MSDRAPHTSPTPRPVRPEDAESLHALLLARLPDVPEDLGRWLARWNWQYRDNPFRQDRPAGWVLCAGGRVVGHLGAVWVPVVAEWRQRTGVIGADFVVSDEALRAGGVFAGLQLAQAFFDGTVGCLRMATTANEKTGVVFGRFGCRPVEWTREFWRAPATLTQQVRTCRGGVNRVVRRLMSGAAGPAGRGVLGAVYRIAGHRPALPIAPGCRLDMGMPEMMLEAVPQWETLTAGAVGDTASVRAAFAIDRNREYLDWRYVRHPEAASIRSLLVRTRDGRVVGAGVVFVEQQTRRKVAFLEELLTVPERPEVMHTLVCAALRLACDHGAEHLVCTAGRADLRGRFWEYGFEQRTRSAPALVVAGLQGEPEAAHTGLLDAGVCFHHGDMF